MSWGDKTKSGLQTWFTAAPVEGGLSWADRIKGWLDNVWQFIWSRLLLAAFPPAQIAARIYAFKLKADPNSTEDQKKLADVLLGEDNVSKALAGWVLSIIGVIPGLMAIGRPQGNLFQYAQDAILRTARFDPEVVARLWLRDKPKWDYLFGDLRDMGWSEDRINGVKELANFLPSPQDLVNWQAKEVFEPAMITKYGLDDEFGGLDLTLFAKVGVTPEIAKNYWRAHWVHASWNQVVEMLHRGLMTEQDVWDWFRLVEIPPYWRQKLIDSVWNIPTRVDVRRFWDMRTIDETRMRQIYTALGYHGDALDDYVLWTKVYTAFPDLLAQWKNGWVTIDQVKSQLVAMGMPESRANEMIQTKIKTTEAERLAGEKDLTRADIIKGVKVGRITRAQGITFIQDLGYSADEASFILDTNMPADQTDGVVSQRELTKSDIAAAVKLQQITPAQAIERLINLRYAAADATFLAAIYAAQIPGEQVAQARELTKGDILKGYTNGIIGSAEASTMLTALGYAAPDITFLLASNPPPAPAAAIETARELTKADIKTAYMAGILTQAEVRDRMALLNYTPADITFLLELYLKQSQLAATTKPKEASKADIVTAVKKGLIYPEDGYTMLIGLGYSDEASNFILSVAAETSPFSPTNYEEFKQQTARWKQLAGRPETWESERLREAAAVLVQATKEVNDLDALVKSEEAKIANMEQLAYVPQSLADARVARNRARAAQRRAQSDYDKEVALQKQLGGKT